MSTQILVSSVSSPDRDETRKLVDHWGADRHGTVGSSDPERGRDRNPCGVAGADRKPSYTTGRKRKVFVIHTDDHPTEGDTWAGGVKVGSWPNKRWWLEAILTACVVYGILAASLSACAPTTHIVSRPKTPTSSTSTIPVVGTSFNEMVADVGGTQLTFDSPSRSIVEIVSSDGIDGVFTSCP